MYNIDVLAKISHFATILGTGNAIQAQAAIDDVKEYIVENDLCGTTLCEEWEHALLTLAIEIRGWNLTSDWKLVTE